MSQGTGREDEALERGLKLRHVNMIAIGGAIGTGLFVGTGGSLSEGGAGGILLGYCLISVMFLTQCKEFFIFTLSNTGPGKRPSRQDFFP